MPKDKSIRKLAWEVLRWSAALKEMRGMGRIRVRNLS